MHLRHELRFVVFGCVLAFAAIAWGGGSTTRQAIELNTTKLDALVGRYDLEPGHTLTVSRFRDRLFAQTTGDPAMELYPRSETVFDDGDDRRITFLTDEHGKVTAARFDLDAFNKTGKRISEVLPEPVDAPELIDSPRVAALAKAIAGGDATAMEKFWKDVQDHAPLVEPFPRDARFSWVTFLYRGDAKTRAVAVEGGIPSADPHDNRAMNLTRLRDTDLWYRSMRLPNDTRTTYAFNINLSWRLPDDPTAMQKLFDSGVKADVLNPKFILATGSLAMVYSLLELPDAPPQPYVHPIACASCGKVTKHEITSKILKEGRTYSLYTPPGFHGKETTEGDTCPLVVMFDGHAYHEDGYIPGPTIIDNLIAAKKIPPIVVAFVDQENRNKDLNCSKDFAAFVAKEIVPQIRSERHVSVDAKQTTVGGLSLGGLMAAYVALNHSDVFGNVISQSGAFWVYPGALDTPPALDDGNTTPIIEAFLKSPRLPVRFYLDAGRFEERGSLLGANRQFRDVLRAKGYDVTYTEFSGGHHFINWRGTFSDALIAVTR